MNIGSWIVATLLAACLIVSVGCRRTAPGGNARPGESSDEKWLTVSSDPAEIQAALKVAEETERQLIESVFQSLSNLAFPDPEMLAVIQRNSPAALDRLKDLAAANPKSTGSVGAGILLVRLSEPAGRSCLAEVLKAGTVQERSRVLTGLTGFFEQRQVDAFQEFLFAEPGLSDRLLDQLNDTDPKILTAAIQCCGQLNVPGAGERFLALMKVPGTPGQDRIAFWLSRGEITDEIFQFAVRQFESAPAQAGSAIALFETAVRQPGSSFKRQSQDILRRYLVATAEPGSLGFRSDRLSVLKALSDSAESSDIAWIQELAQKESGLYAVSPLVAWIRLEPATGMQVLLEWIESDQKRSWGLEAATRAYAGNPDPSVVERLTALANSCPAKDIEAVCDALNAIGGDAAHQGIRDSISRADADTQIRIRRTTRLTSMQEMVTAIQGAGLMTEAELVEVQGQLKSELECEPRNVFDILQLGRTAIAFDSETGMLPCRHDNLIRDLAKITRGKFHPEGVIETWNQSNENDDQADYTLQFVCSNRLYRGKIRNLGDWYDVERIVAMINTAAQDSGTEERLLGVNSHDQTAMLIWASPARIQPVADRLEIELTTDLGESARQGLEFEKHVMEQLKKELD